eukprot:3977728-Prymnesium_polylepis.1
MYLTVTGSLCGGLDSDKSLRGALLDWNAAVVYKLSARMCAFVSLAALACSDWTKSSNVRPNPSALFRSGSRFPS